MMSSIRDIRQKEFATKWLESNRYSILNLTTRFGKIRCSILILNELKPNRVLICYPDEKIKNSWIDDFEEWGFDRGCVTFSTFLSMHKFIDTQFDIVIIDECHLLSQRQIETCKELFEVNPIVLGLSGTISKETEKNMLYELNWPILATYSMEQAIAEGVIVDYEINVIKVPLDNKIKSQKGFKTEKQKFNDYSRVIDKLEEEGKDTFFLRLSRMRLIQNSVAKRMKTRQLLEQFKDDRVLVFCGNTKVADSLGIPSFHSKSPKKSNVFEQFASGEGNQLAVVRIGGSGITYKPLNKVIINYFDSNSENLCQKINRATSFEYNNPDKKAKIYIIASTEDVESKWLSKALSMFSKDKIKYL